MMEGAAICSSCKMFAVEGVPILAISSTKSSFAGKIALRKGRMQESPLCFSRAQVFQPSLRASTSRAIMCAAALNARCAAEQTQTVTRQSSTITIAPIQGKEKSPELDDGGSDFPPRDDDGDGGGGGGGGGPNWSGGFFFFGLLAFLGFLKDKESEGPYRNERRKYSY